ncbi:CPBP family intramembrane glutamic endopeptidase [Salinirubrum litoreum]|uniref:CPBP family intramembrane glutamic endopeptidase n=1 Tax=Salinirubrum litoreum TaxID=1126234 RepID=A0ABD5RD74_9EURY
MDAASDDSPGLRRFVWNADERRPRAPIRLLLGILVLVVFGFAAFLVVGLLVGLSGSMLGTTVGSELAGGIGGTLVTTAIPVAGLYLVARLVDRRWFGDFGFHLDRDWWLDCAFGAALGVGLMAGIFGLELAVGWLTVTGFFVATSGSFASGLLLVVVLFVGVSIREELLLRGWFLTNLAEGTAGYRNISPRTAVVFATLLSSVVFGILHAANPNATAISTASISLAGVFLALGYLLTGELAIPIGLHFTWNLFQGSVFGFPVSGLGLGVSVIEVEQAGPELVTGGQFGPEAGLIGMSAMVVGSLLTVWWVRWRTGEVRLDSAVWTPALRWHDEESEEAVETSDETEPLESVESDESGAAGSVASDDTAAPTTEVADDRRPDDT